MKNQTNERIIRKWAVIVLFLGSFLIYSPPAGETAYTIDVPYQQAVPDFLEAITDATESVKDENELQEISV